MPNAILEELAERVQYLAMMMVQGTGYPLPPQDVWKIIDPSGRITKKVAIGGPPYTEFTNQLQILNIIILFTDATITDIFKPSKLIGDNSVLSIRYINSNKASIIETLCNAVIANAQENIAAICTKLGQDVRDVYDSEPTQYTEYMKAALDTIVQKCRETPRPIMSTLSTELCNKKRREIFKLGYSYNQAFTLKTCAIALENTSNVPLKITPKFTIGINIDDDNTIKPTPAASVANVQINQMQPTPYTGITPANILAYNSQQPSQPGYIPQQPQYQPSQPGYIPQQGFIPQQPQYQPAQGVPSISQLQPGYAQQPVQYQQPPPPFQPNYTPSTPPVPQVMPSSSIPPQITPEQGHAAVNQAAETARETLGHIPGANGIIDKLQQQAHGTIDKQPPQVPTKPTRAERRRTAKEVEELKGVQDAKKTVAEAHENITPKPSQTTQADALAVKHKEEDTAKQAELNEKKKNSKEAQAKAKEELNEQHASALQNAKTEDEKKKLEEQHSAERKKLKADQKTAADAEKAAREQTKKDLAKQQSEERKTQKAAQKENMSEEEKAKRAELNKQKKQLQDEQAKEKAALAEQHKKEDEAKRAELKQKKSEEKAAHEREKEELKRKHEAKLLETKDEEAKNKLRKEHEAAEKKLKDEHDKAAKAAKDERNKIKKELEQKQEEERKAQKATHDKAASEAKAARKAAKAAVPKKPKFSSKKAKK